MPWTSRHTKWLVNTGSLKTSDGKDIEVWEFQHHNDQKILSLWAKHFRNHYCLDTDIDEMCGGLSRSDYLTTIKFPSRTSTPGPSIRAGDFGEILVSDFLEWILGFWVPRVRWSSKTIRNESPKGSDVIGFKFHNKKTDESSKDDALFVCESKTKFSNSRNNCFQEAIKDSAKDHIRIDESLNFIKQKLFYNKSIDNVQKCQAPGKQSTF